MVFVEVLRLIMVLAGALIGLAVGQSAHNTPGARVLGAGLGVLIAYAIGGGAGRLVDRGYQRAARQARDLPAPELLAGLLLGTLGLVVGVIVCLPIFVFVKQDYDYPVTAGVAWILGYLGLRTGMSKGRQLSEAARLTRRLDVTNDAPTGGLMIDTSAAMDRAFLVLGLAGLLGSEVLVPEPVTDELRTLADGADPVSSRRARRALEAIGAIRTAGVDGDRRPRGRPGGGDDRGEGARAGRAPRRPARHLIGGDRPPAGAPRRGDRRPEGRRDRSRP